MNSLKLAAPLLAAFAFTPAPGSAAPILGQQLSNYAVLGASTVTNTGATTLTGNLGVSNNTSLTGITGFYGTLANDGPGTASGSIDQGGAFALAADEQLAMAKIGLGLLGPGTGLTTDLSGLSLASGVYTVPAGMSNLTGTLTLDGGGNANAFWVFQMASTLITSPGSMVNIINTGAGAGVYWNIGSSATLDSGTAFLGNILASTAITINSGVTFGCGRALAHTGAVTLIGSVIDAGDCSGTGAVGSMGLSGGLTMPEHGGIPTALPFAPVSAVPEPGPLSLFGAGLAVLFVLRKKWAASPVSEG